MNNQLHVSIRHAGNLIKIQKAPYETEEKAYDRAWYIAKKLINANGVTINNKNTTNPTPSWEEISSLSHIWANEKYLSMKYK